MAGTNNAAAEAAARKAAEESGLVAEPPKIPAGERMMVIRTLGLVVRLSVEERDPDGSNPRQVWREQFVPFMGKIPVEAHADPDNLASLASLGWIAPADARAIDPVQVEGDLEAQKAANEAAMVDPRQPAEIDPQTGEAVEAKPAK